MAIPPTPLSRRPSQWFLLVLLLPGLGLSAIIATVIHSPAPIPVGEWVGMLWLVLFIATVYWNTISRLVTDYDADYFYLFKKAGTEQIPLGSFYRLSQGNRGAWYLYHLDEQGGKKKLTIYPLGRSDNASIHGFISAIWQHNPLLDVQYDWLFK